MTGAGASGLVDTEVGQRFQFGRHGGSPMFPAAFDYRAPATLDEALGLLAQRGEDAKVMAGGQSLIPLLRLRFAQPAMVIDIGRLPAMAEIKRDDGHVRIGALVRHVDVEHSKELATLLQIGRASCRERV